MNFPPVSMADWRAQVEKELAGASFEKVLVHKTIEGLTVAPLYAERPSLAPIVRGAHPFRVCMPVAPNRGEDATLAEHLDGADAVWLRGTSVIGDAASLHAAVRDKLFVIDLDDDAAVKDRTHAALGGAGGESPRIALGFDPLATRGASEASPENVSRRLARLGEVVGGTEAHFPGSTAVVVSTLPYHDAGADAADEIALALSTGALYLESLAASGIPSGRGARAIALRVAVGRDTFLELCKLRALRICWQKLLVAASASEAPPPLVHAVCSSRTLTVRDPWVNMLRVTTQTFAAILGGADLVTPATFDQASGASSDLGRRVARNTGLVLREESLLGKVIDPAGGSYYLETLTDALAREAWKRFRSLEQEGGIRDALASGRLQARLEATWAMRLEQIAKRRIPILGVSEFANLDESLPPPGAAGDRTTSPLAAHRDAEAFEALRTLAETKNPRPEAALVVLGPLAESRPRASFAAGFFTAGGIRTRETTAVEKVELACLCGSDERYATEAVPRAQALKAAGCRRVLLAGRPGPQEAALREAGVDGFVYVGCDVVATLEDLVGGPS